jgi:hypothetical protein
MFVRVRGSGVNDPPAEFLVPLREFDANPHLYVRVDGDVPRKRRVKKSSAPVVVAVEKPGENDLAPSGADSIGDAHDD